MKKGYKENIEDLAIENTYFRKVLYTGGHMQLVLMSLRPLEEIGLETHHRNDQFFRFEKGQGKVMINETEYSISAGDVVIIPAGSKHNIINTSDNEDLKLYTIYSPAHHKDGIVRETKKDAESIKEEFDGVTTE
ncbi:MAG: cupin domain-containing protein [Patescibacteria group bacterium]|nr:cupin domain-containing protein [Patescibacteria group bacterium]